MTRSELSGTQQPEDAGIDGALRPSSLTEFVGQQKVRGQLKLLLDAAKIQSRTPEHLLFAGPPGLGKTTLSMIVATEMSAQMQQTSGPAIQHAGDLAAILSGLTPGEVLFIDEIHRMARSAEEMLYLAMEDYRIDIMVGKGAGASSISLDIAPFTLIGATTRAGMLPNPLRDRFGFTAHFEFYETEELARVIARTATLLNFEISQSAIDEIASRSRGTPRIANRLLRRVRDFSIVHGFENDNKAVSDALTLYDVDEAGLDRLDREVLLTLLNRFGGGPVGIESLAISIGEEPETIESVVEPFLVRSGFILRTPRGRVASDKAWSYTGISKPDTV